MRNRITLKPMRWRSSRVGSAAQLRNVTTSCAICGTLAWVPSANLTWSGLSGGGIFVAGRDRVDVILAAFARLGDQRQVRRQGAVIGGARRLVVGKRTRDRV